MDQYLMKTKSNFESSKYKDIHIVLGNESCDLDSAVCSLVYATFLYWQHQMLKCKVCTKTYRDESAYFDDIFVPVFNVNREDYELKSEVAYCLKERGIDAHKLFFRDDFNFEHLIESKPSLKVTLVDHHVLATRDQVLYPYVVEVIDHRPLDKSDWRFREDMRATIETAGSCASVLTQKIRRLTVLMNKGDFYYDYRICAHLLHCTIILDTLNFHKKANKGTQQDVESVKQIEELLRIKPEDVEEFRKSWFDNLLNAKKDVSRLTPSQILKKDCKVFGEVMVPSFFISAEEFLNKPGASEAVTEAMSQRQCAVILLLGVSLDGDMKRDVAVYSTDVDKLIKMSLLLQTVPAPSLDLQKEPDIGPFRHFRLLNTAASRKQYIPAIVAYLKDTEHAEREQTEQNTKVSKSQKTVVVRPD